MVKFKAVLAGVVALFSLPASASVVVVTYSGMIDAGYDNFNDFGTGNTDIAGQAITGSFTYDTGVGNLFQSSTELGISGGSQFSIPSPASSTFDVNGHHRTNDGLFSSFVGIISNQFGSLNLYSTFQRVGTDAQNTGSLASLFCSGGVGEIPFDLSATYAFPSLGCQGVVEEDTIDRIATIFTPRYQANFTVTSLALTSISQVPLPAGGALLGTGVLALARFRRRKPI